MAQHTLVHVDSAVPFINRFVSRKLREEGSPCVLHKVLSLLAALLLAFNKFVAFSLSGSSGRPQPLATQCRSSIPRLQATEVQELPASGAASGNAQKPQPRRRTRNLDKAELLVAQLRPQDVKEYNIAINSFGGLREWQHALSLLKLMRNAGISPDLLSFNAAISACEKDGQGQHVLSLLDDMGAEGVTPDAASFGAAVSACKILRMACSGVKHCRSSAACEEREWRQTFRLLIWLCEPVRGVVDGSTRWQ